MKTAVWIEFWKRLFFCITSFFKITVIWLEFCKKIKFRYYHRNGTNSYMAGMEFWKSDFTKKNSRLQNSSRLTKNLKIDDIMCIIFKETCHMLTHDFSILSPAQSRVNTFIKPLNPSNHHSTLINPTMPLLAMVGSGLVPTARWRSQQ